jgi:uncharacterized protein YjbI with pentapeptide repeats
MIESAGQYVAVLVGETAKLGPMVMRYTVAVQSVQQAAGQQGAEMPPCDLPSAPTARAMIQEAERVLESKGWRVAGDWSSIRPAQHWFDEDYGGWAVAVMRIADRTPDAGAGLAGQNLAGQNLTAMTFSGAFLAGTDLSRAILTRADLSGADLTAARLSGAVLHSAKLAGANLTLADLTGADLTEAKFHDANLNDADLSRVITNANTVFTGATMVRAKLVGARISFTQRVDLTGADLTNADLRRTAMHHTCLRGATLAGTNLYHADLLDVDLTGATLPDLGALVHVTWDDRTTWDPSHEEEIRKRSSPKPSAAPRSPEPRQTRGLFRRRRPVSREQVVQRWILNPLPELEFERAVIEQFRKLLNDRGQTGLSGDEFLWATAEELAAGVSESMGRTVPGIAVWSFLSSNASENKHPPYTLFCDGPDGRYRINPNGSWHGDPVTRLLK